MKLTKNFYLQEFQCKCGCEMPQDVLVNIQKLASQLQTLRNALGKPIDPSSGYRCESHNKAIGGAENSQHIYGMAADIKVKDTSPKKVAATIERLISDGNMLQGGIGIYKGWVHYDFREKKARW